MFGVIVSNVSVRSGSRWLLFPDGVSLVPGPEQTFLPTRRHVTQRVATSEKLEAARLYQRKSSAFNSFLMSLCNATNNKGGSG